MLNNVFIALIPFKYESLFIFKTYIIGAILILSYICLHILSSFSRQNICDLVLFANDLTGWTDRDDVSAVVGDPGQPPPHLGGPECRQPHTLSPHRQPTGMQSFYFLS